MAYDPHDVPDDVLDDIAQQYEGYAGMMDEATFEREVDARLDLQQQKELRDRLGW